MTVESPINRSGPFIASGATGVFPRNFLVFDPAHVRVVRSRDGVETDITTGISHSGMGSANGAVTLSQGIQAGDRVTLLRNMPNVQRSDYSAQSSVPTDQVELDFDLMAMQVQDLAERQRRALTLPVDSTQSGEEAMRAALAAPQYALEAKQAADRLASIDIKSLPELTASTRTYPQGSVLKTRAEGFTYEVVSAGGDVVTAGGVYLRALSSRGAFDVAAFGARLTGVADDGQAFQRALTAAAETGRGVLIPGGSLAFDGPLTLDLSAATEMDELKPGIVGLGSGVTEIKGLSAAAVLNILGSSSAGDGRHGHASIRGIKFTGPGTGLNVERLAFMSYEDLFLRSKSDGMTMTDVLSSRFYNCQWRWGSRGITMNNQVVFSRPNAMTFYGCHWGLQAEYGIRNIGGSTLGFYGGSIEGCGKSGSSGLECGLRIEDAGRQGEMALDLRGLYIEANGGTADVIIAQGAERAMYNISACTFNRTTATGATTHNVYIVSSSGDGNAHLNITDCAFGDYNAFTPTASQRYVQIADPADVIEFSARGNTYETLAAWPDRNGGEIVAAAAFNGTVSSPTAASGKNIASVSKTGTGVYVVTFRRPIPAGGRVANVTVNGAGVGYLAASDDTSVTVHTRNLSNAATDFSLISLEVVR